MRLRTTVIATLALFAAITIHATQSNNSAKVMLEAAKKRELVDGDLKGAVEQYKKIVDQFKSDRAIVAEALVRMAGSYLKLGDAKSQTVYARILKEFPDQPSAVAEARRYLGDSTVATQMSSKRVWVEPAKSQILGGVSHDGQRFAFVDWEQFGDLFVRDVTTGANRRVTNTATDGKPGVVDEYAEENAFSRDGTQLAYSWFRGDRDRYELRLVDLSGAGTPEYRVLVDSEEIEWIAPMDWSPDGKWIAVQTTRKDSSSQIALVNVRERTLRVLKSTEWSGASAMFFSKDGKYLAYDLPSNDPALQRDIFVIAVDGSSEVRAVRHPAQDALLGWSPDGERLVFASDRTGSTGIWALPFIQGRAAGEPKLLKRDATFSQGMGITDTGVLFTDVGGSGGRDIQVASVDLTTGSVISAPAPAVQKFEGANSNPDWSPDGKYLAYVSERGSIGGRSFVIGIRNLATGESREVTPLPGFNLIYMFRYAPDGRAFVITGRNRQGSWGIFRVDAQTGQSVSLLSSNTLGLRYPAQLSSDGKKLYVPIAAVDSFSLMERDLKSGAERELIRRPSLNNIHISPSTRYAVVGSVPDRTQNRANSILLVSTASGETRELMHVDTPQQTLAVMAWASDNQSVIILKFLSENRRQSELWKVPIDQSQPTKLNLAVNTGGGPFRLHPDGKQIVFVLAGPSSPSEVWALANFLPALELKK